MNLPFNHYSTFHVRARAAEQLTRVVSARCSGFLMNHNLLRLNPIDVKSALESTGYLSNLKMQKWYLGFLAFFFFFSNVFSQKEFTAEDFESQFLAFTPKQGSISDADFQKALLILEGTKAATKGRPENFNVADYWNASVILALLDFPAKSLEISFRKAASKDAKSLCAYIQAFGGESIERKIPSTFRDFVDNCGGSKVETKPNVSANPLESLLIRMNSNDQRYRSGTSQNQLEQRQLDERNQWLVDSLYQTYGTYVGNQLVSQELEHVMWAVIQHSNLNMMERYLPIIHRATKNGHLSNDVMLKMLIDRIYAIKYDEQIFGSQEGVRLADEESRNVIKRKYDL